MPLQPRSFSGGKSVDARGYGLIKPLDAPDDASILPKFPKKTDWQRPAGNSRSGFVITTPRHQPFNNERATLKKRLKMNKTIIDFSPSARVSIIGATNLADALRLVLSQLPQNGNEYFYVDLSQTRPDFDEGLDMLGLDPDGINALTLDELDTCTVEEIANKIPEHTKVLVIADAG